MNPFLPCFTRLRQFFLLVITVMMLTEFHSVGLMTTSKPNDFGPITSGSYSRNLALSCFTPSCSSIFGEK